MTSKNPHGPLYGAAGAVAALAVCAGAVVLAPGAASHDAAAGQSTAVVLDHRGPSGDHGQPDGRGWQGAGQQGDGRQGGQQDRRPGHGHGRPHPAPTPTPSMTAPANKDCVLLAPANPLTAQGLATPYQLTGGAGCTMANAANLGAFVQATIAEPGGQLAVYNPLVVTAGTQPAAAPPVPALPAGSVVTIDTGFNGNVLTIAGPGGRYFVQGLPGSPFGQVSFANGPAFFATAQNDQVPALGMAADGLPCPTTRDFSLIDQDQSDNVTTSYTVLPSGQTEEAATGQGNANNGSDNLLLTHFVDAALGCTPFAVPNLSSPGTMSSSQALDELQAMKDQQMPVALVPPNDPMTTVGADADITAGQLPSARNLSAFKTDLYRAEVGQPPLSGSPAAAAGQYCQNLTAAGNRVMQDAALEAGKPDPNGGNDLAGFMKARYANSLMLLNCKLFAPSAAAPDAGQSSAASTMPSTPDSSMSPAATTGP